jgi:hypothetical protein
MPNLACGTHTYLTAPIEPRYTATAEVSDQDAQGDEGQLLTVLAGCWLTVGQLDTMFRSTLFCDSAKLWVREQHVRIANSLLFMLSDCSRKGLVSSTA